MVNMGVLREILKGQSCPLSVLRVLHLHFTFYSSLLINHDESYDRDWKYTYVHKQKATKKGFRAWLHPSHMLP